MTDIDAYIKAVSNELNKTFGARLKYLGLQGSFSRNEATEGSDIDLFVVLDEMKVKDMDIYRGIINSIQSDNPACGFICGEAELKGWNACEICQIVYETKNIIGRLQDFVPAYTKDDVENYIKINVGNIYHALCHTYIHSTPAIDKELLINAYKTVFYLLQNLYWLKTGVFIHTREGLRKVLQDGDLEVMKTSDRIRETGEINEKKDFNLLFLWCRYILSEA